MDRADVIILGGGLVGLALASALDASGVSAVVVDPADPEQRTGAAFDGRTSAVSSSSMRMLEAIGVADHLVAADGRNSPMREQAGIRVAQWRYAHHAIVSVIRHVLPHDNVAYEIFYPTGPFALLPMNDDEAGHRSAIVWSVPQADAAGWLSLGDDDFAA